MAETKGSGVEFFISKNNAEALASENAGAIHFTTEGDIIVNKKKYSGVHSVTESVNNGKISVDGTDVAVHGLGSAAFANLTDLPSSSDVAGKQDALTFTTAPSADNPVVTKTDLDAAVSGASNYLGTLEGSAGLSANAKKGDFYRVKTAFGDVHVGDIVIAEKDSPTATIDGENWSVLHNEINTDMSVADAAHHYTPLESATDKFTASVVEGEVKSSGIIYAIKAIKRDSKGHVVGIESDAVNVPNSLPASDVPDWAKAANKPTYNASDIKLPSDYVKPSTSTTSFTAGTTSVADAIGYLAKAIDDKLAGSSEAGTLTSVAVSVPTGFQVLNSPVTTSGTIEIKFAEGYSLPSDERQARWDAAAAAIEWK